MSVSGFGILITDEFAILVLLAAEFTPIWLSFRFTLDRVGGLVGTNRRSEAEALGAAAHPGDLSNLLFPTRPYRVMDQGSSRSACGSGLSLICQLLPSELYQAVASTVLGYCCWMSRITLSLGRYAAPS